MGELLRLMQTRKWQPNRTRLNISDGPRTKGPGRPLLVNPVFSNALKSGRILKIVQGMLPGKGITQVTLNKNLVTAPHRDAANTRPSYLLFLGDFKGGALRWKGGSFNKKNTWFGPYDGRTLEHWNDPIISGDKYSIVAYSTEKAPMP